MSKIVIEKERLEEIILFELRFLKKICKSQIDDTIYGFVKNIY